MQFFYRWFYKNLPLKNLSTDGNVALLTTAESKRLRALQRLGILLSAAIGAIGVLLLYVPKYWHPEWFFTHDISVFGNAITLPIGFMLYSFVLVFIELELLTMLNIYCLHQMAVATGFLHYHNHNNADVRKTLLQVSLEKKDKDIIRYGINPLEGMNVKALFVWNLLIKLKATLSNMLFKFLVQRMLGRYALQWVKDFGGLPIFAAWNAWGTHQVLQQGRVVIMGQNLVETTALHIYNRFESLAPYEELVFNTLQFVAISKRDYHANHACLAKALIEHFGLKKPDTAFDKTAYYAALKQAPHSIGQLCKMIVVLGFLLDGYLSTRELKKLEELRQLHMLSDSKSEITLLLKNMLNGKGLEELIKKYLSTESITTPTKANH